MVQLGYSGLVLASVFGLKLSGGQTQERTDNHPSFTSSSETLFGPQTQDALYPLWHQFMETLSDTVTGSAP